VRVFAAALLLCAASIGAGAIAGGPAVNDAAITGEGMPARLSDYGFFADPRAQKPAAGVTPYRLQTPLWTDGADKRRFVYVPRGMKARAAGDGLLDLPVGSALVKTFSFGDRLIETRVLLRRADGWTALPYRWNEAQSDATLALGGARFAMTRPDGQAISYAIPNKNQCKDCHKLDHAVAPIGPKARNLSAQWLMQFQRAGRLDAVPLVARRVPLWEDRAKVPAEAAARGYLDANCAHCHNPRGAASNSGLDLTWEQADPLALGIGKRPVAAGRGAGNLDFDVVPGDPAHSILFYRMGNLEAGVSMPEIGRSTVDPAGMAVVERWIAGMKR